MKKLTQKELKRLLHYDPETGIFRWLVSRGGGVKAGDFSGNIHKASGYKRICIYEKFYRASRLAFFYMEGYWPEHEIDHMDGNKANDKWKNLRHVSRVCNLRNQRISCKNKSGITGVSFVKRDNKWRASIGILGKTKNLGHYINIVDAVKARWEAEIKYGWPGCDTNSSAFEFLQKEGQL